MLLKKKIAKYVIDDIKISSENSENSDQKSSEEEN